MSLSELTKQLQKGLLRPEDVFFTYLEKVEYKHTSCLMTGFISEAMAPVSVSLWKQLLSAVDCFSAAKYLFFSSTCVFWWTFTLLSSVQQTLSVNRKTNCCTGILPESFDQLKVVQHDSEKKGLLYGVPVSIKENIAYKVCSHHPLQIWMHYQPSFCCGLSEHVSRAEHVSLFHFATQESRHVVWCDQQPSSASGERQRACWSPEETRRHSLREDQHPSSFIEVNDFKLLHRELMTAQKVGRDPSDDMTLIALFSASPPSYDCSNPIYGQTVNPHNPQKTSGGSSGGEGALIGGGGSLLGLGSDIGGSIRIPASFCGICGFKPTAGRLRWLFIYCCSLFPSALCSYLNYNHMFWYTVSRSVPLALNQSSEGRKQVCHSCNTLDQLYSRDSSWRRHWILVVELVLSSSGPMAKDVDSLALCMQALLCDHMFDLDPTVPPLPFNVKVCYSICCSLSVVVCERFQWPLC